MRRSQVRFLFPAPDTKPRKACLSGVFCFQLHDLLNVFLVSRMRYSENLGVAGMMWATTAIAIDGPLDGPEVAHVRDRCVFLAGKRCAPLGAAAVGEAVMSCLVGQAGRCGRRKFSSS